MVYMGEGISDFRLCCGRYVVCVMLWALCCGRYVVQPVTGGKGAGGVALESEGWKCSVDDLRESVWCLAYTEVSSAKTEACDC